MKNVENFGVLEMSYSETQEIEGGLIFTTAFCIYALCLCAGVAVGYYATR